MVEVRQLVISALVLTSHVSAFRCPGHTNFDRRISNRRADDRDARFRVPVGSRARCASTALMMVSEREEELKAKIARLRGAASKGDTYEQVVGKGADLTEKMSKSKGEFDGDLERAQQVRGSMLGGQRVPKELLRIGVTSGGDLGCNRGSHPL